MLKDSCFCGDDNNGGRYVSPLHKAEIILGFGNGSYRHTAVVTRLEMLGGFRTKAVICG
jgi:hypothetical protein